MRKEKSRSAQAPARGRRIICTVLHEKHSIKGTALKVSKGRRLASGDKEKAEQVSRNERPLAATIEAADVARRGETSAFGKTIVLSENSIISFLYGNKVHPCGGKQSALRSSPLCFQPPLFAVLAQCRSDGGAKRTVIPLPSHSAAGPWGNGSSSPRR